MSRQARHNRGHCERPADQAAPPPLRQKSFPLAYQFVDLDGIERKKEHQ